MKVSKTKNSEICYFGNSIRFGTSAIPLGREFSERPSTSSARSCSFGIGKRSSIVNADSLNKPSPDQYTITQNTNGGGVTIKGKPNSQFSKHRVSQFPGPGAYNNDFTYKSNKFTFFKRNLLKYRSISPGPCAYQPKFEAACLNQTGGFIPKASHIRSIEKKRQIASPGPGAYSIISCFGENRLNYPKIKYKKK